MTPWVVERKKTSNILVIEMRKSSDDWSIWNKHFKEHEISKSDLDLKVSERVGMLQHKYRLVSNIM